MDDENFIPAPASAPELNKQTFFSEYRNLIVVAALVLTVGVVFFVSLAVLNKSLAITKPFKSISLKAGDTYSITWSAKGISSVGVVLFNGGAPQWVAKGISAGKGKFDWTVLDNQESGSNYRLAVFEYPWKKGNTIAYTRDAIEVIGPQYASCNDLAAQNEWPYLPGDYPNAKRVFITDAQYNGNLGGLEGADAKCQLQADANNYKGKFIAFLGTNKISAKDRVSPNGVYVMAKSEAKLAEGQNCYRLIGRDIDSLLNKGALSGGLMGTVLDSEFARLMTAVWFGRRTSSTKTECLQLGGVGAINAFSVTFTCQDWTTSQGQIYAGTVPPDADLTHCYTQQGSSVLANYNAANASGLSTDGSLIITGTTCDRYNRLMCVEQ